jgi:DNA modification methylase
MELFSKEGDLVIDTCVGAGTTAVAAKKLKRRFVGAEIEERFANAAKNRLAETVE